MAAQEYQYRFHNFLTNLSSENWCIHLSKAF